MATAALVTYAGLPAARAAEPTTQRVGTVPTAPGDATKTAAPADDTPVQLSVHLKSRDAAGAEALANAVSDKSSPQYHRFLKSGEFAQRFGADPATVAKVTQALTAQGLHPEKLAADGLTIPVNTTVSQAKRAFDVDLAGYQMSDGRTGFLNTNAPAVRSDVAGSVAAVVGFNTLAQAHANHVVGAVGKPAPLTAAQPNATSGTYPTVCAGVAAQFPNLSDNRDYFSPAALASVYGLNGMTDGGAGTTVAVFALEDYSDAALSSYQSCFGTNASVQRVRVNTGAQQTPTNTGVGVETALDLDTVIGLAPRANVLVYQGPDAYKATPADIQNTYRQIVADNRAQVVTTSWGICDQVMATSDLVAERDIFLQAALQGQTVVAASGDDGSSGCNYLKNAGAPTSITNLLSTSDPASQPFVTGVGGTTLSNVGGNVSEKVWNSNGGASGGGVSRWSLKGGSYQSGFYGPGYNAAYCQAAAGAACRQVPDVAANADPATGYMVATGPGYWTVVGGTSASAPLWAAIAAHQNGSAGCAGPLGFISPTLYQAARTGVSPLRDVTTGNNDIGIQGGLYPATAGYDMATGLGTPKADKVMTSLCPAAVGIDRTIEAVQGGQLHEVYTDAAGWHDGMVPGVSGVSALSFTYNASGSRVIEAIENGELHEIYTDATGWHDGVIPGLSGITAMSFSYSPSGARVIEAIKGNELHEIYSAADGWHDGVIPGLSGITAMSFSYSPSGARVIEAIKGNELHEIYSASDGWHDGVIPGLSGITALSFNYNSSGARVIEAVKGGQLHEIYSASDGWHDGVIPGVGNITALSAKIAPWGDRVIEATENGALHEVHSTSGGWYDTQLPVAGTSYDALSLALR
ncbi:protease pro-enzyme activation domain-containing protein [Streptomyces sp. FH025]|uniref:S53 family peptidase n=1 Tax=Streptomyces sp. FH025 TaxID=2815937 RepID=UPI001A9CDA1F|nr:S53 family peptidase [Streptomyces sp. FH025]MBO1415349.1 S8/S53 family peptidase [Streptomyces sp. FH025]